MRLWPLYECGRVYAFLFSVSCIVWLSSVFLVSRSSRIVGSLYQCNIPLKNGAVLFS